MEMDPATFDAKKMKGMMELGVNRVSLGVQAFQEELLKACGRAYGVREVYEAMEIVGERGVENWSMDLISSLPYQTPEKWEESMDLMICKSNKRHEIQVVVSGASEELYGFSFGMNLVLKLEFFCLQVYTRDAFRCRFINAVYEISSYYKSGCIFQIIVTLP